MNLNFGLVRFVLATALFLQTQAFAQTGATVTIPSGTLTSTLVVESSYGGTVENGTSAQPYKSITGAVARSVVLNNQGRHVRIRIKAGQGYRETVNIPTVTNNNVTLTLEAFSTTSKPYLFGSDFWDGNTFGNANPINGHAVYYHWFGTPWPQGDDIWNVAPYNFPLPPVVRRRENIRLGDLVFKRVLTYGELTPGSFYVNDSVGVPGYGNYFVCPPTGTVMNASTRFEVGMRTTIINCSNRSNLYFKDLNFDTGADYFLDGQLKLLQCNNVRVDGCKFAYACSKGAQIGSCSNVTVFNCSFYKCGICGLAGSFAKNFLVFGSNTSPLVAMSTNNNWRGANGNLNEWDSAGIKFFQVHDAKFENIWIADNAGRSVGLWLDTDVKNVTVLNVQCVNNYYGLFYESAQGPCTVDSCNISGNYIGLYNSAANFLTTKNSIIGNNYGEGQIVVYAHAADGGRFFTDFETGTPYNNFVGGHMTLTNNKVFWNADSNWKPLIFGRDTLGLQLLQSTLGANTGLNKYWHPTQTWVFHRQDGTFRDLAQWKSDVGGKDNTSTWTAP